MTIAASRANAVSPVPRSSTSFPFSIHFDSIMKEKSKSKFNRPTSSADSLLQLWWFFLLAFAVKFLLIPSYRSTDFEVHRHWLALTHSLPFTQWYFDETSEWTLDYPPFFAYFERFLSVFANLIDPQIVDLHMGLNYSADSVVYFQRVSVMLSDLSLLYAVYRWSAKMDFKRRSLMWVLVIWSPLLVIVDHIHFQYNGFLLGILLISLSFLEKGNDLMGGFIFAILLCFKHLFAVAAPVYFVYLLRHYCRGGLIKGFSRLFVMGSVVAVVFAVAYGPFIYHGQIEQVFHRMFPFGRGLCHAYWAPNFWVFYIVSDKVLAFIIRKLGFDVHIPAASFTGGLVGDSSAFAVLPQITPFMTFSMVLLALLPCLFKAWRNPRPQLITRWVAYAYTCGFLFGWHVHEKASLHFVIPLAIVAVETLEDARHYFLLSTVSCYSLFPLLHGAQEYPIKASLLLLHSMLMWLGFSGQFNDAAIVEANAPGTVLAHLKDPKPKSYGLMLGWMDRTYLLSLIIVEMYGLFLHRVLFGDKLPFVPLMMISIYCAFGMMYSWFWQFKFIIRSH